MDSKALRLPVIGLCLLLAVAFQVPAAFAADQVLEITAAANHYAHLYRAFPNVTGSVVAAELKVKVGPDSGSSWVPSLWLYWSPTAFIGIGQQPDVRMRVNMLGLAPGGTTQPGIRAFDWTDVQLIVTPQVVQVLARPTGGDWVMIFQTARTEAFAGLPKEIIIGKGFSNNTDVYPAEHLDNSTEAVGRTGVSYIDNLLITVDGKTVLNETFASLDGWGIHQAPNGNVSIKLVAPEVAEAAFIQ